MFGRYHRTLLAAQFGAGGASGAGGVAGAIEALAPSGWWKNDDAANPVVNYGTEGTDGSWPGTGYFRLVEGPDGEMYWDNSGTTTGLQVASTNYVIGTTGITAFYSFKPDTFRTNTYFVHKSTEQDYTSFLNANSSLDVYAYNQVGGFYHNKNWTFSALATGVWHTALLVLPVGTSWRLYMDSATPATINTTGATTGAQKIASAGTLQIAGAGSGTNNAVDGGCANFAMFDRALSVAECETLMGAAIDGGWTP